METKKYEKEIYQRDSGCFDEWFKTPCKNNKKAHIGSRICRKECSFFEGIDTLKQVVKCSAGSQNRR